MARPGDTGSAGPRVATAGPAGTGPRPRAATSTARCPGRRPRRRPRAQAHTHEGAGA